MLYTESSHISEITSIGTAVMRTSGFTVFLILSLPSFFCWLTMKVGQHMTSHLSFQIQPSGPLAKNHMACSAYCGGLYNNNLFSSYRGHQTVRGRRNVTVQLFCHARDRGWMCMHVGCTPTVLYDLAADN